MAPTIHLVRHAQGYHNLSRENEAIRDPDLTQLGEEQCAELCKKFPAHDKITHLVASPIRRTTYTCLLSFAPAVQAGKKVVALPEAQEVSTLPCDIGSPVEKLQSEFGDRVDYSLLDETWNDKSENTKFYPTPDKLAERAREVRVWLRELVRTADEDSHVVLVTHGGILHFITSEWDDIKPGHGTGWKNTEFRSYQFKDLSGDDAEASLQETEDSWKSRRGTEVPLTRAEQVQYHEAFKGHVERLLERAKQVAAAGKL